MAMAAGLVVAAGPTASAENSITDLGVRSSIADHSEVVAGGGKVFVAAGDRVVVTDIEGVLLGAVTGLAGVDDVVATPDGAHAYAALPSSHEVVEIDTAALAVTRRISFTAYSCLADLALSGQTLWTAHGCDMHTGGVITRVDVSAPDPQPVTVLTGQSTTPTIAVARNTLLSIAPDTSSADVRVYDVSNGSATLRGEIDGDDPATSSRPGLNITQDGSTAILAFPRGFESWDLASLTKLRDYGKDPAVRGSVAGAAISADGDHLAGGWSWGDRGVELYDVATGALTDKQKIPSGWPTPRILTMTIAGNDVFCVLYTSYTTNLRLWRLEDATLLPSAVTLSAPDEATALEPVTLNGRLTLPEGVTPRVRRLEVTRRLPDGTSTTLRRGKTKADGTFSITDIPPVAGTIGYDVSWHGSATVRGSKASVSVDVARQPASLTLAGRRDLVLGDRFHLRGTLKFGDKAPATRSSVTVIRGNPDGTSTDLGTVQTSVAGRFRISDLPDQEGEYIYNVLFMGDDVVTDTIDALFVTVRARSV